MRCPSASAAELYFEAHSSAHYVKSDEWTSLRSWWLVDGVYYLQYYLSYDYHRRCRFECGWIDELNFIFLYLLRFIIGLYGSHGDMMTDAFKNSNVLSDWLGIAMISCILLRIVNKHRNLITYYFQEWMKKQIWKKKNWLNRHETNQMIWNWNNDMNSVHLHTQDMSYWSRKKNNNWMESNMQRCVCVSVMCMFNSSGLCPAIVRKY